MQYLSLRRVLSISTVAMSLLAIVPAHAWTLTNLNMLQLPPTLARTGSSVQAISRLLNTRPSRRQIRESGRRPSRSSFSRSSHSSFSSASTSSVSTLDPDTDVSIRGRIAVLGSTSPVLGSAKAFNNAEPLRINMITIRLDDVVTSVDTLLVYDHDGWLLGSARLDSNVSGGVTYTLNLKTKNIIIPQREDYSFYVRAILKSRTMGGVSAEFLKIDAITLEGNGVWSNRTYTQGLSGTFNTHQIARSVITSVTNAGAVNEPLLSGGDREIGKFRFIGVRGDGGADLRLTQLAFTVSQVGSVTLSDIQLVADGSSDRTSCSMASSTITCALADSFGSLASSTRILTLLADVTVSGSSNRASLQVSLNEPGTPSSAGAIQWTDGTTTFDWVGFEGPIVRGTYYSY